LGGDLFQQLDLIYGYIWKWGLLPKWQSNGGNDDKQLDFWVAFYQTNLCGLSSSSRW
jgi:hypothetical protein